MKTFLRPKFFFVLCLFGLFPALAFSQALARPGWAGFGTQSAVWWQNAAVYEIDPHGFGGGLHEIAQHLDYVQSLSTDAILLTHFQLDAAHPQSVDPAVGTLDDLDELIHTASTSNMRILVDLGDLAPDTDLTGIARYWLNRGVAGFHITGAERAAQLRKIASTYIGQRIVIGDVQASGAGREGPQLQLNTSLSKITQLSATALRPAIEGLPTGQNTLLATDSPADTRSITRLGDGTHDVDIAKILAAILFTNRSAALIYSGQEVGLPSAKADAAAPTIQWGTAPAAPEGAAPATKKPLPPDPSSVAGQEANPASLLRWYRQLIALHHSNGTIASAPMTMMNHDDQNLLVWVHRPPNASYKNPAVFILCNLSAQPLHVSLKDDVEKLHLKGTFLRTVLRSYTAMGAITIDNITLPPFAVFVGELGY